MKSDSARVLEEYARLLRRGIEHPSLAVIAHRAGVDRATAREALSPLFVDAPGHFYARPLGSRLYLKLRRAGVPRAAALAELRKAA